MSIEENDRERDLSIYIHIPYCTKKCPYCDFNSHEMARERGSIPESTYSEGLTGELDSLISEGIISAGRPVDSIFIGGGTPTLFSPESYRRVLGHINGVLPFKDDIEITIEANPESLTEEKATGYLESSINRLSIGIQSFDDKELKILGRLHSGEEAKEAFNIGRRSGFANIGIDLIFGLPRVGGTGTPSPPPSEWSENLRQAVELAPDHISAYGLTIEGRTPFSALADKGTLLLPGEEAEIREYDETAEVLGREGYKRYEVSNFAREGFKCRHNERYWDGGDYIGLGAGAHSFMGGSPKRRSERQGKRQGDGIEGKGNWGRRWWNIKSPEGYIEGALGRSRPVAGSAARPVAKPAARTTARTSDGSEVLTCRERATEALFLGLRTDRGVDTAHFRGLYGIEAESLLRDGLRKEGLIKTVEGRLILTRRGLMLSNEIFK